MRYTKPWIGMFGLLLGFCFCASAREPGWPRQLVNPGGNLIVYQPQSWADPPVGIRCRLNFNKGWFSSLSGDAGGFGVGSPLTWQIYSGVGKEFKDRYSFLLGYRYMFVDYRNGGFLSDIHMTGPLVGFAVRVK